MKVFTASFTLAAIAFVSMASAQNGQNKSPLVVGKFEAGPHDTTFVFTKDKNGKIEPKQITLIIDVPRKTARDYDFMVLFDVTNTAKVDLRVVKLYANVKRYRPLPSLKYYLPLSGIEELKGYFGLMDKKPAKYPCELQKKLKVAQVLKPGDLDVITLGLTTATEGIYDIDIVLEYSVGGKVGEIVVGQLEDVMFVTRETAFSIDRTSKEEHVAAVQQLMRETKKGKYWLRSPSRDGKRSNGR